MFVEDVENCFGYGKL